MQVARVQHIHWTTLCSCPPVRKKENQNYFYHILACAQNTFLQKTVWTYSTEITRTPVTTQWMPKGWRYYNNDNNNIIVIAIVAVLLRMIIRLIIPIPEHTQGPSKWVQLETSAPEISNQLLYQLQNIISKEITR